MMKIKEFRIYLYLPLHKTQPLEELEGFITYNISNISIFFLWKDFVGCVGLDYSL